MIICRHINEWGDCEQRGMEIQWSNALVQALAYTIPCIPQIKNPVVVKVFTFIVLLANARDFIVDCRRFRLQLFPLRWPRFVSAEELRVEFWNHLGLHKTQIHNFLAFSDL
eukprot:Protomagalhaensia_wolfi_Nauph_80__3973@NODE_4025_length_657_cov_9_433657_g3189_i0_p2_GENE_NODE_4025_length_657_cov_9_433657_g3189_i0NODE_4025_length_657_cov_9_433657_g3189_i0_p2_ORF_typecomplete_len111_score13_17_NODE_4025_length_657_cov_9_433657_g3189_i0121453